ncbi:MAG: polyketide cyclase [Thermomicrobiales bacterium]|jgi:hypothetical protein|nr:polyketide cyclase [Thermomicrobiales bacterium]
MTMRANTRAVTIPASVEEVFAFLGDPGNLPRWAVGFARGIRRDGGEWIVQTAGGEFPVRVAADVARGTIDFHTMVAPGVEAVAYSRVTPNGSGVEYVFTHFQEPGMADDVFEGQRAALAEELALLPVLFRARGACPAGQ